MIWGIVQTMSYLLTHTMVTRRNAEGTMACLKYAAESAGEILCERNGIDVIDVSSADFAW